MTVHFFRPRRRRRRNTRLKFAAVAVLFSVPFVLLSDRDNAQEPRRPAVSVLRGGDAWKGASGSRSNQAARTPQRSNPGAVLIDRATRVRDGDTIVVGLIPIRIANLDCAETGTRAGETATRRARQLVAGETLTCRLEGRQSYDREVGVCALSDGRDFGEVLISEGYCRRWR